MSAVSILRIGRLNRLMTVYMFILDLIIQKDLLSILLIIISLIMKQEHGGRSQVGRKIILLDCDSLSVRVVKRYDNSDILVWCWQHDSTTEDDFWFLSGSQADGAISDSVYPFVITKSYQTMPSEQGTLSSIVLLMKSTDGLSADIEVLYSLTENGDDFQQIIKKTAYEFSGDMERFQIPLHPSFIANAHHYRLKIIVSNHLVSGSARSDLPVYLYNIERRFRVRGYSR